MQISDIKDPSSIFRLRPDQEKFMDSLPLLPHKLLLNHILTRLPGKFVLQCILVCKIWCRIILDDKDFALSHTIQYSQKNPCFLYELGNGDGTNSYYVSSPQEDSSAKCESSSAKYDTKYLDIHKIIFKSNESTDLRGREVQRELIGSCNGLVCLYNKDSHIIEVCNPTRNHTLSIHIPHPIIPVDQRQYGFGYDSKSGRYLVVCILFEMSKCKVLILGRKWVEIPFGTDLIAKLSEDDSSQSERVTFFNEYIQSRGFIFYDSSFWWIRGKYLLSFHLIHMHFQVTELPPESLRGNSSMLLIYKENLCCAKFDVVCKGTLQWSMDLYVLEAGNHRHVWRKERIRLPFISPGHSVQLVDFNNQLVLHRVLGAGCLATYNLHTKKITAVRKSILQGEVAVLDKLVNPVNPFNYGNWAYNTHVENLLSLEPLGCRGVSFVAHN